LMAHAQRLSSDEIYTLRIAQQPTVAGMIRLSRALDLHPPLHYFAERVALSLHAPVWLAARLPSILAGQLTLLAIFLFTARRLGNLLGLVAACVYTVTPAMDFSWSNRPYALWFLMLATMALLWRECLPESKRQWMLLALGLSALLMVMDDMFGLVCLLPFFAAEALRARDRSRMDWPVVSALLLPSCAGLLYLDQVSSFATNTFTPRYLPSMGMSMEMYGDLLTWPVVMLLACGIVVHLLFQERELESAVRMRFAVMERAELVVMVGIGIVPAVLLMLAAAHHTQFFARYGACGSVGIALLAPVMLRRLRFARPVAVLMTAAMLLTAGYRAVADAKIATPETRASEAIGVAPQQLDALDQSMPIVVAGATEFTEMNDREPEDVARRLFYLTDRTAAQQYSGQTVFETEEQTVALLGLPGKAEDLQRFLAEHERFYLVGDYTNAEQWVMRDLLAHGAQMQYRGKFISTTQSDDLYEVSLGRDDVSLAGVQ